MGSPGFISNSRRRRAISGSTLRRWNTATTTGHVNVVQVLVNGVRRHSTPVIRDFYNCQLTASGHDYDDTLLAKFESIYTYSGDHISTMFVFNIDQGLPVLPEWLSFNRVTARLRQGYEIGPARLLVSASGGHMERKFAPHEAFAIGGRNIVRGYEEGVVGSGRSYTVGSGEVSYRLNAVLATRVYMMLSLGRQQMPFCF
ncbi:outer envelope protein 80, chloroplastic-like [Miscanthus floridulus]|uniref:outer envelope protein 80, chloroplastic-like n=1 Tax=Miscanthus floridulus TaxID=154761 RepID=UPI0034595321